MNEQAFCQSCSMPMGDTDELYGTEADGSKSSDYCQYCYVDGAFTYPDATMEEMIEVCVPHMTDSNPAMTPDAARAMMQKFFPALKRWQGA